VPPIVAERRPAARRVVAPGHVENVRSGGAVGARQ
jgi:hypothetical protein